MPAEMARRLQARSPPGVATASPGGLRRTSGMGDIDPDDLARARADPLAAEELNRLAARHVLGTSSRAEKFIDKLISWLVTHHPSDRAMRRLRRFLIWVCVCALTFPGIGAYIHIRSAHGVVWFWCAVGGVAAWLLSGYINGDR